MQVLKQEIYGELINSGNTLILAPSVLNIGGKQWDVPQTSESAATLDTGTLEASTLYYVYATIGAGKVIELISSKSEKKPSGVTSYRKVGAFETDQNSDVRFTYFYGFSPSDGNGNARLVVTNEGTTTSQSTNPGPVTVQFDTIKPVTSLIDWDVVNEEATIQKSGDYELSAELTFHNTSNNAAHTPYFEIDQGLGFVALPQDDSQTTTTTIPSQSVYSTIKTSFMQYLNKGDKIRLRAIGSRGGSVIMNKITTGTKATYPRMIITPLGGNEPNWQHY